jgi:hypothetical protein
MPQTQNLLTARTLKVTLVLDPNEILALLVPDGQPRCLVRVTVAGRTLTADLNAKSVRKAIATIRASGPDAVVAILQGKLDAQNQLIEAGLSAQPKVKPEALTAEK